LIFRWRFAATDIALRAAPTDIPETPIFVAFLDEEQTSHHQSTMQR
jgi:hypothetical protein